MMTKCSEFLDAILDQKTKESLLGQFAKLNTVSALDRSVASLLIS